MGAGLLRCQQASHHKFLPHPGVIVRKPFELASRQVVAADITDMTDVKGIAVHYSCDCGTAHALASIVLKNMSGHAVLGDGKRGHETITNTQSGDRSGT